ncbi:S1C family serine protease [Frigoribacterium sp. CFBP9030]|uniref:S1C family serine protease n=1 Tax=Frigoribacterium sp. CFBP9030 TaxID=3096537 RepID=UPI002A699D10|nr:trypsin-like peptidase domain-containing protein [Frigoribacterium sp. CFBP9030]MDY0890875.1 trypsin-like peptidase domain-containing protein [Frigoribacterium sp. CFBP9030]
MNDHESDTTDGTDGAPGRPTDDATTTPAPTPTAPADARRLPHVTGSSDARYVNAPSSTGAHDTAHQSYDASSAAGPTTASGTESVPAAFARPRETRRPKRWMLLTGAAAALVLGAGGAGGAAYAIGHTAGIAAAQAASQQQSIELAPQYTSPEGGTGTSPFGDGRGSGGTQGGTGDGAQGGTQGSSGGAESSATAATSDETAGVVTIVSTLNYDDSYKSAGTGMILDADGLILTNNHVVQGATSIEVTDETTGRSYTADVVGTDATNDVAVLQLQDASGLTPVSFGDSDSVSVDDAVHSTGNAEGTGDLVTAAGSVLATDQSIQVQSETGTGGESLSGLIEIQSDVVSGDSGGPLRDADGDVVGIVTAASSGTTPITGYAIPIDDALSIAKQIVAGNGSDTIRIGLPPFLGAQISQTATGAATTGVPIAGTVAGSAAESAGLVAGDTITALDGTPVADASALTAAVQAHESGDSVSLAWTDAAGASHTATVTLGDGPAA